MTEMVTDHPDVAADRRNETTEAPAGSTPTGSIVDTVLDDELVEDVSIDGMCGVY